MTQEVQLLEPGLAGILFVQSTLVRKVDDAGFPIPAPNTMDFRLTIAGELLTQAPDGESDEWKTVGRLSLTGRGTPSDDNDTLLLDVGITALGTFPHPKGKSKEYVDAFNEEEFNLVRLLMQMYPATILKLTTLCEEAGFSGLKLSTGMPPRRPPPKNATPTPITSEKIARPKRRAK